MIASAFWLTSGLNPKSALLLLTSDKFLTCFISSHFAFNVMFFVIGVLKSKVFPSSCHSANLYPSLVGFVGAFIFSPSKTSIALTLLPPSVSNVTVNVVL